MSRTFSLGCHECKVEVWIGQRDYLYTTPGALLTLQEFLFAHQRHQLGFYDDEGSDYQLLNVDDEMEEE